MKYVIAMPIRDKPTPETVWALENNSPPHLLLTEVGKPVDEARNALARQILELDPMPEIVVWLDDDAWWLPGAIEDLVTTLQRHPGHALMCGGFSERMPHSSAVAGGFGIEKLRPGPVGQSECNVEYGQIVPIEWCGFHAVALRTSALYDLGANPFSPLPGLGEDYTFCRRLIEKNLKLACNPAISFAHIEISNGLAFLPGFPPFKIENGRARAVEQKDLATMKGTSIVGESIQDSSGIATLRIQAKTERIRSYGLP